MIDFSSKRIATIGDSITRGVVATGKEQGSSRYRYIVTDNCFVEMCKTRLGVEVYNYAVFGSTVLQGMKTIARHGSSIGACDYVVLCYGGNDSDFDWPAVALNPTMQHQSKVPLDVFREKYVELVEKVRELGAKPVMLSLPVIQPERLFDTVTEGLDRTNVMQFMCDCTESIYYWHEIYNIEVFKIAASYEVPLIDITSPFLAQHNFDDYMCADGIHPNEKGHKLIADAICSYCENYCV